MQLRKQFALVLGISLLIGSAAHAVIITGFGGNGTGWTLNGGATVVSDTLTITTLAGATRSAFYNTAAPANHFNASFTYTNVGGGGADGFAFVVQNAGTGALGGGGGGIGYAGLGTSAALEFNIYTGFNGGNNTGFGFNGNANARGDFSLSPVNIDLANTPVNFSVNYYGGYVTEKATQGVNSYTRFYNVGDLTGAGILNSPTAFVGFTGATGGVTSLQTISNFTFNNQVPEPSTLLLLGSGLFGLFALARRIRK